MDVAERLGEAGVQSPEPFRRRKDGSLEMSAVIAERKSFLSSKKLLYRCRLRVDEDAGVLRFWEALVEKGSGVSGDIDDISPGVGFKVQSYKVGGKTRQGSIEEQSRLFGKDFTYQWDYATVRRAVSAVAAEAGLRVETVLKEKSV